MSRTIRRLRRSPTKYLSIVKRRDRARGRRPALRLGLCGSGYRWVWGCVCLGLGGGAERQRARARWPCVAGRSARSSLSGRPEVVHSGGCGSSRASTPCASVASNVTPSIPGAPSFCLAIAYAARRVSILQTWTYRPQKRQGRFSLRLDVYPPPQVLQINGRLYHLVLAFPYVGGIANGRAPSLHGHYPASLLIRTHPPPSRLRPTSRGRRLFGLPCSGDFSSGRGGLLQLLSMSLSPCCRFHPAEVNIRIVQSSAAHAAFALRLKARPSGILTFEATTRLLLLRPGDS